MRSFPRFLDVSRIQMITGMVGLVVIDNLKAAESKQGNPCPKISVIIPMIALSPLTCCRSYQFLKLTYTSAPTTVLRA